MRYVRLSIPGNYCVHCDAVMTEKLQCEGCGWVDPLTSSKTRQERGRERILLPTILLD